MRSDQIYKMNSSYQVPEPSADLLELAALARRSSRDLAQTSDDQRRQALISMAKALSVGSKQIVEANLEDLRRS